MSDLPEPLVPEDCDLRGLTYMPMDVLRLLDSDIYALSTGDEFKAALGLWCKAWNQVPAGSVPSDERVLAKWVGISLGEWRTISEVALRGWVECSDGRLYHPVVCEKALEAWLERLAHRRRSAQGNASRYGHPFDAAHFDKAQKDAADALLRLNPSAEVRLPKPASLPQGASTPPSRRADSAPEGAPEAQNADDLLQGDPEPPTRSADPLLEGAKKAPKGKWREYKKDTVASDEPIATADGKDEPWKRDADFQLLWSLATPEGRRRAKSQANVWPEWRKAKRAAAPAVIIAGMGGYLAGDPDVKRTGGPGLHLWLRGRTWENWTADTGDPLGHDWSEDRWAIAVGIWRDKRSWDERLGPEPGEPGCRAPKHLLIEAARAA